MGNLQYRKVTREVEDISFTCGVPSIDEYVRNSYYPTIVQQAYGYSISGRGIVLEYRYCFNVFGLYAEKR